MELKMTPTVIDACLYFQFRSGELIGINGSYVDDLLHSGNGDFKSISDSTLSRLEISGNEEIPFSFAGILITRSSNQSYAIDQSSLTQNLTQLRTDATFK